MWPNPKETMIWSPLPKKSLIENFIFFVQYQIFRILVMFDLFLNKLYLGM